ncbi:MAG: hypothetical protein K1X74_02620 [Pirellulales bacterium]|nr:hypothetical protein [Pirellulales bacterium]
MSIGALSTGESGPALRKRRRLRGTVAILVAISLLAPAAYFAYGQWTQFKLRQELARRGVVLTRYDAPDRTSSLAYWLNMRGVDEYMPGNVISLLGRRAFTPECVEQMSQLHGIIIALLDHPQLTDADLVRIEPMYRDVFHLQLGHQSVTARSLAAVRRVSSLEWLTLEEASLCRQELEALAGHANLQTLDLQDVQLGKNSLMGLERCPRLESLILWTDTACDVHPSEILIPEIATLESLLLDGDASAAMLAPNLSRLRHLNVFGFSDAAISRELAELACSLPRLQSLSLMSCTLEDGVLEAVAQAHQIERLDLSYAKFDPAQLQVLKEMPNLRELMISDLNVPEEVLQQLQSARPLLQIMQ